MIVNEAFAELTGLGRRIVGRRLTGSWTSEPYEIVGVVQTTRFAGPSYPGTPMIYWRVDEEPPPALTLVARVSGDAKAALAVCRDAVRAVDPAVPVYDVKTFERRLSDTLAKPRFYTECLFFLGGLAVLVAVAGVYGSAARAVAQRRREMGVRLAIGATSWQVRALIVRELLAPVTAGAGAGIAGALVTGRYVEHLIAEIRSQLALTNVHSCRGVAGCDHECSRVDSNKPDSVHQSRRMRTLRVGASTAMPHMSESRKMPPGM